MHTGPKQEPKFFVRILRHAPEGFGWEIHPGAGSNALRRSKRLFDTRIDAIFDSAAAAATLNSAVEPSAEAQTAIST
jgi:hypothetical protein